MIVVEAILPVLLLAALGWYLSHIGWLTQQSNQALSKLAYFVLFPATLFLFTSGAQFAFVAQLDYLIVLLISTLCISVISFMLYAKGETGFRLKPAIIFNLHASVSNVAFVGYPIFMVLYGEAGIPYIVMGVFMISCVITPISILCLGFDKQKRGVQSILGFAAIVLKDPLFLACLLGLLFSASGWSLPAVLTTPIKLLSQACIPIILISIGAGFSLSGQNYERTLINRALLLKNVLHPVIALLLVWSLNFHSSAALAAVLVAALPSFKAATVISSQYGYYTQESPRIIIESSLISIPILSLLIFLLF